MQSLWFSLSKDGGKSWSSPNIAVAGMTPAWGPVLHYEAKEQKLWLFYSLSMIDKSPGGDLVYRTTTDIDSENPKWSAPVVLWRSEDAEGQPKVRADPTSRVCTSYLRRCRFFFIDMALFEVVLYMFACNMF